MYINLAELPQSAVFAIVNHRSKRVFVSYSMNLTVRIGQIYSDLMEYINNKNERLKLEILDANPDIEHSPLFVQYWVDYYTSQGYTFYRTLRVFKKLKPSLRVSKDLRNVQVVLYDKGYRATTVGVFDTVPEAKAFIQQYYATSINPYCYPIYSTNNLTKSFLGMDVRVDV